MLLVFLSALAFGYHLFIYGLSKFNKQLIGGLILMSLYLLVLYGSEPSLEHYNKWSSRLFTFVPFVSFSAILFPSFNRVKPELITIILGYIGLIISLVSLVYFKFFYWTN